MPDVSTSLRIGLLYLRWLLVIIIIIIIIIIIYRNMSVAGQGIIQYNQIQRATMSVRQTFIAVRQNAV